MSFKLLESCWIDWAHSAITSAMLAKVKGGGARQLGYGATWLLLRLGGRGDIEECAGHRDALGTVGGGEGPVVADANSEAS